MDCGCLSVQPEIWYGFGGKVRLSVCTKESETMSTLDAA